jgi:hypothetical protein
VFFVISGFVITHAITRRLSANRFRLRDFYLGRVRRLLPALATMLVIVLALSAFIGTIGSMGSTARTGGAASLINANTYLMLFETTGYFDAAATLNPLLQGEGGRCAGGLRGTGRTMPNRISKSIWAFACGGDAAFNAQALQQP